MLDKIGTFLASLTAFDWATIAALHDRLSIEATQG